MPVVNCPQCPTKLRVPDGATGSVKCPKCSTVFPVAAPATPAFEVVDETPPKPAAPAPKPAPVVAKSIPKPVAPVENDFEFDDEKPKKKKRDDDDDDDDRPRGKKKSRRDDDDDDDEDDRPRSKKKRSRDDDDDDDDDRPRGKKKRRDDDDDDDDDWHDSPSRKGNTFGPAKVGMQLLGISLWIYLGTFAMLILFVLLAWVGVGIPSALLLLLGLAGLTNWILALTGLGFAIAGPPKTRGLAIAATAVSAVHLILGFVVANKAEAALFGLPAIQYLSYAAKAERINDLYKRLNSETDAKRREKIAEELRDASGGSSGDFGGRGSEMRWSDLTTLLPYTDRLVTVIAYDSKAFEYYILPMLAGLTEIARLVLIILLIGSVARAAKSYDAAEKSSVATIVAGITAVVPMVLLIIVRAISSSSSKSSGGSAGDGATWLAITALLVYGLHLGGLFLPALMAGQATAGCRRKAR